MKKLQKTLILGFLLIFAMTFVGISLFAQSNKKDRRLVEDSRDAIKEFIHTDSLMKNLFSGAYGYAVFPTIGKGAFVVGGAGGDGTVFQKDSAIGKAKMSQLTVGLQAGGQAYREVIFFQDKGTLDRFMADKVEFSAQVSAVAATQGGSANAKYADGLMIFTQQKGGLMFEASVGGQKFNYTAF